MPNEVKENKTLYRGQSTWINKETGEEITTDDIVKKTGRNGFMITYLSAIINLMDKLGNKKMQVVKYILENMDKSTNTLIITTPELAIKAKVSRPIVSETLKILEDANIIARRTGAIMIHSDLVHRGSEEKEKFLLARFEEFGE
ncbi:MAG: replication/maintenance protein RepL [Enterococcus sp.]|nr:replication/maintenance protein RepL [Enterococcus sp.]